MFTLTVEDSNTQIVDQFSFDHGSYVIGRLDECDIVLPSTSVSRQHARIFIENGRCFIEDMGSANGVIVDGQRVIQRRDLGTASQIRVGDFYLYVEFKAQQDASQSVLNTLFISDSSDHHKLVRINDAFAGEEFSLSEIENTIGRTDENFILLSDSSISRRHAKIIRSGNSYTVVDLESSNGTRLNGKPLRGARTLEPSDVVEFGDIQFVFAEGGEIVNVAAYAPQKVAARSGNSANNMLAYLALGVGVVVAASVIYFVMQPNDVPTSQVNAVAPDSVEGRVAAALRAGNDNLRRHEWPGALSFANEALALAPGNQEAQELQDRAYREQKAAELLRQGEEFSAQGRHEQARSILLDIAEGTVAHERSKSILAHVEKTLVYNLKNEASRTMKNKRATSEELAKAHYSLSRALSLSPSDAEALQEIEKLEATLKKKKVDFKPYAP
ncbi:FHA domain-containing protein [Bradymonas sediminis]|uniref:Uncharacterized protein n=1 Tax=Bradymonas sediminis TaxID=1548548 RepID=A0A2Z4FL17_9DELT|nr:FHA domain-containing protein [Bradymonas sediminis]AWV89659.1 hypothetical protein DN745_10040 [Bradymonas sediminis]TDP76601.1 type III secretion system (T3SS) inner membrane Yop/YscD-like protein [Bradymonas sediminis]